MDPMNPSRGAAVVLAAGLSSRMGRTKALLPYQGKTFLRTIRERIRAAGVEDCWVVLGPDSERARGEVADGRVLFNPAPERGPLSSLRLALAVLPAGTRWVMMALVDHPAVKEETLRALIAAADAAPDDAVVLPVCGGRRGHPVVFGRALFAELLAVPENEGARAVVRRDPARVREVACDDPGILKDVDTPADLQGL